MASATPKGPVFVTGCPRSGTSALGWAVAACEEYWTSSETHFFFRLLTQSGRNPIFEAFKISDQPGSWLDEHDVSYDEFLTRIGSGLNALMLSRSGGIQWVDNSPENLLVADDLLMMFPDAAIIHVIRDPREVCASMLLSNFHREVWSRDLGHAIATWKDYAAAGRAVKARHPERVLEVMNASMRNDPDAVAADIASFLRIADGSPIARFLTSKRVNSSYDAASKVPDADGRITAASKEEREAFLHENAQYIVEQCEPYVSQYGFTQALPQAEPS